MLRYSFIAVALLSCFHATANARELPNVVLIFADDLGYGDIGCYGATKVKTPAMDRLASQGRKFTDAHSASAVCTPSRYALLTGEYPSRRPNLWGPVMLRSPLVVDTKQLTLAKLMQGTGYATACIGKWHLGFGNKSPTDWNKPLKPGPLELGFDHFFGMPVVNSHPPFVYVEDHHVVGLDPEDPLKYKQKAATKRYPEKFGIDWIGGGKKAHKLYDDETVGKTFAEKSAAWIKKHKDKPFFLYLATTHIHHPFTPALRFNGTSECGPYGDFIHELDWIVERVMAALDEAGVADNTLVIFTSDNGGMLNQGGQKAWKRGHRLNGDLLGFKFDAWEGGHRVPMIVRWPGKVPSGSTSDQLISNVDMLATLAAVVGRPLKQGEGPDSVNMLAALTDTPKEPIRDHLVISPRSKKHLALRAGDWMYISAAGGGGFNAKNIGDHLLGGPAAHKLTKQTNSDIENNRLKPGAPPAQLYHLGNDRAQAKNVIREHPDRAQAMKARLNAILAKPQSRR